MIYLLLILVYIYNFQNVQLISKDKEIIIKRDKSLNKLPLFKVEIGKVILGEEKMNRKIIIDKKNVLSTSHLIQLIEAEFSMYNNATLCNNLYKISKRTKDPKEFGYALFAVNNSNINIYGGEISNNVNEVYIPKDINESILPEIMETHYYYDSRGVGIFMNSTTLNIMMEKYVIMKE